MPTDDLEDAVRDGIYGDDRMTSRQVDGALAALTELVRRLEAAERRAADVVPWLREVAATMHDNGDRCAGCVEGIADAIERGEHIGGAS